jgi:hypothetical protein
VNWDIGASAQLFVLGNLVIAFGYVLIPATVLPHLPLPTRTLVAGAVFFVGCTGSHLTMAWQTFYPAHHASAGWFNAGWHVVQAAGTITFILFFRLDLIAARRRLAVARQTAGLPADEDD